MPVPTAEQERVLDEQRCCAVIASPGSGKTFTVAEKIRRLLPAEPHFRGVIAISFTNKASDELRRRATAGGFDAKGSFFGTIDKFLLTELIFPFGPRVFGRPGSELEVARFEDLDATLQAGRTLDDVGGPTFGEAEASWYGSVFQTGRVTLECSGGAAIWILKRSAAARRYLKARYTWVFIDEYQDCGYWQDRLFIGLCLGLGLRGVAVGDLNQSIYGFAKKDPKYLEGLTQRKQFRVHALTTNRRSHTSIVNYATRFLAETYAPLPTDELRVFHRHINGDETDIGRWIGKALASIMAQYGVNDRNHVGVLVKNSRTAQHASRGLREMGVAHRLREETGLDRDTSLWGGLFRSLMSWLFSPEVTKYEVLDRYLDVSASRAVAKRVLADLRGLDDAVRVGLEAPSALRDRAVGVARLLLPTSENRGAVGALMGVLSEPEARASYAPVATDEVHLMTLHKSKGLEFDIVFHLDLYEYILPNPYEDDKRQAINLHYVGITRAKHACVLCSSSKRHKASGPAVDATPSSFLDMHGLATLRRSKVVSP